MGMICENITANNIKNIPNILISFKNWSKINHAKIAANIPSRENIIAAGAGDIFCKLYVCSKNASALDKIPTYKISYESFNIFDQVGASKKYIGKIGQRRY